MKASRYTLSPDGNTLRDNKEGTAKEIHSFELGQSGRHAVVHFNLGRKDSFTLARYTIDESAFSLGGNGAAPPSKKEGKKRQVQGPGPLKPGGIVLSKEELLELHQKHRELAEFTFKLLMAEIKRDIPPRDVPG